MATQTGERTSIDRMGQPDRRMRITFVITALGVAGAEIQVVQLARELHRRGWAVSIVSMIDPFAFGPELAAAGIPVNSLGMRRGVPDPRAVWRLAALLRRTGPTILHSHMFHANLLARITRLVYRAPVLVSTVHTAYESSDAIRVDRLREAMYRITDCLAERTTVVCREAGRHLIAARAVRADKLTVIPNGVDKYRFRHDPAARERVRSGLALGDAFVWLAVGRIIPVKDYSGMIAAFDTLHGMFPTAQLIIAGDGELRAHLAREIATRRLTACVRLLGTRTDMPALMNAADAYVLSSRHEGLPLVLLEASATGLPIVATRTGGVEDVVVENETGLLADPGKPEALARAMQMMMSATPQCRGDMGRQARERAEKCFDLRRVADRWEDLYFKEIEAHDRGGRRSI